MLRRTIMGCLLAIALLPAWAEEAGRVVFVTGDVRLAKQPAKLDNAVQEGDELQTGADGYVYVKTVDNGFLILRPGSRARVTAYHIDADHPANTRVKLELLSGVARSISGVGVKQSRQNFRFNTPVAAIGVRGTDFIVFTDQQTSRVSVMSGGVVVSGFGGACGPEGGGPCEGSASRELYAGQGGMLLQIRRGEHVPQLLHSSALSPDQNAAPRSDEPVGKVPAGTAAATSVVGAGTLASADINLDPKKSDLPEVTVKSTSVPPAAPPLTPPVLVTDPAAPAAPSAPTTPVAPTQPSTPIAPVAPSEPVTPVVPPVPIVPGPPEVFWGRWQTVAGLAPDPQQNAKLADGVAAQRYFVGPYEIAQAKNAAFVMPTEGTASFALSDSQAVIQRAGVADVVAAVDNAKLDVDFAKRSFSTSLTVSANSDRIVVNGQGDVAKQGNLTSNSSSDTVIRGFLGGAHAEEAGYIFQNTTVPGVTVVGATKWGIK